MFNLDRDVYKYPRIKYWIESEGKRKQFKLLYKIRKTDKNLKQFFLLITHTRTLVQTNLWSFPPSCMNIFKYDQGAIYTLLRKLTILHIKQTTDRLVRRFQVEKKIQRDCITKVLLFVIPAFKKKLFWFSPHHNRDQSPHTLSHDDFFSNSQYMCACRIKDYK